MKKVKRIISLLLTLALVIGLAPSVSFAGESSQRNTYSFSYYAFNRNFLDTHLGDGTVVAINAAVKADMTYESIDPASSSPWALYEYVTNNGSAKGSLYDRQIMLQGDYAQGFYVAFKIRISRAGAYKADTVYDKGPYSGNVSVYLDKFTTDTASVMIPDNIISGFDQYNPGLAKDVAYDMGKLYFDEPGDYLLVYEMKANENTSEYSSGRMFMYINSFSLSYLQYSNATAFYSFKSTALGSSEIIRGLSDGYTDYTHIVPSLSDNWAYAGRSANMEFDLNATTKYTIAQDKKTALYWAALKIQVPKAGSYDVRLKTYQNNTSTVSFDVYIIPFTPDVTGAVDSLGADSLIGYVDGENSTGEDITDDVGSFTADSAGDYIVVFKARAQNPGYTSGTHYMYLISLELDGVTNYVPTNKLERIEVFAGKSELRIGETAGITLRAYNDMNAELDLADAEIEYTSSDEDIAAVSDGIITATGAGTANISVSVTIGGVTKTDSLQITVSDEAYEPLSYSNHTIDLNLNCTAQSESATLRNLSDYNDYSRVNTNVSDKWAYAGRGTSIDIYATANYLIAQQRDTINGLWIAVMFEVPEKGIYDVKIENYKNTTTTCTYDAYIIPYTEDIQGAVNSLNEGSRLGTVAGEGSQYVIDRLRSFSADSAGDYVLIIKATKANQGYTSGTHYIYPKRLMLNGYEKYVDLHVGETDLWLGMETDISAKVMDINGGTWLDSDIEYMIEQSGDVVSISGGKLITEEIGQARVSARISLDGVSYIESQPVTIAVSEPPHPDVFKILTSSRLKPGDSAQITGLLLYSRALTHEVDAEDIEFELSAEDVVAIEGATLIALAPGKVYITGKTVFEGIEYTSEPVKVVVYDETALSGKTSSVIYTAERRAALAANAKKYSWIQKTANNAINASQKYLNIDNTIWNLVVAEGLPRYKYASKRNDPDNVRCRYCGVDLREKYSLYPWRISVLSRPWKVQCPDCRRVFPSNDFEKYYKLGLNEHGVFDKDLAAARNEELKETGHNGYLYNNLYPEKGEGWGVDDGFGYVTGYVYPNGTAESHNYIAYYLHFGLWSYQSSASESVLYTGMENLMNAYLYTGEIKYGRVGAIMLDRIADLYPDFHFNMWNSWRGGGGEYGTVSDNIWSIANAQLYAKAYDAFYPAFDDPYVIRFLSEKAEGFKLDNPKSSAGLIRKNIEDNILRATFEDARDSILRGNFGMVVTAVGLSAVVLDTQPETDYWLAWNMAPELPDATTGTKNNTGGNILTQIIDVVDRDGNGNEGAVSYNRGWVSNLIELAETIADYAPDSEFNMYNIPKFQKMFTAQIPLTIANSYTPNTGDTGHLLFSSIITPEISELKRAFMRTRDTEIAKLLYKLNGDKTDGLYSNDWDSDPTSIQREIQAIIDEQGEFDVKSNMLPGYGFASIQTGEKFDTVGVGNARNTHRGFYMDFGPTNYGHGHKDMFNLGIHAYGLNIAPDLGYPEQTGHQPHRKQWVAASLSHNTLIVDGEEPDDETGYPEEPIDFPATPIHYDGDGKVQLIDLECDKVYDTADIYRRTMVMVDVNDEISYGVDFFKVKGGKDHLYTFHALSQEIADTENLNLTGQVDENGNYVGSYAGPDAQWGEDPNSPNVSVYKTQYLRGATWLNNIDRDANAGNNFAVDFKIRDFNYVLYEPFALNLRLTMVNDFSGVDVAIADSYPPNRSGNPRPLKQMLVRRRGEDLDSLFTTVYEPYNKNSRYIESIGNAECTLTQGELGPDDSVKAVKITHKNGRTDYIVYSTNNNITVDIDGKFEFRGFVGVYTLIDGINTYSYICDGETIGGNSGIKPAYTGVVEGFSYGMTKSNHIDVAMDTAADTGDITGRFIHVENGKDMNAVYQIKGVSSLGGGKYRIDIGDVTLINSYVNSQKPDLGYVYNIANGQRFRIPLSMEFDSSPVFIGVTEKTVDAGSRISVSVSASSPLGLPVIYKPAILPRGASFDPESRSFIWVPEQNQLGENLVSIKAVDSEGREAVLNFIVTVAGSTQTKKPKPDAGSEGPGNGGGGGTTPTPQIPDGEPDDTGAENMPGSGDSTRFKDLTGYEWASPAVEKLAKAGIIHGTGANVFSPGANIIRADFVILLVRALDLKEISDAGQFSDVNPDAYYAQELKRARDAGIISGTGNNEFAPNRPISRQDMMVILYNALKNADYDLEETDVCDYPDFNDVSDYAKTAVATLVNNGLVKGSGGLINPKSNTTRAEIAVLLERVLSAR